MILYNHKKFLSFLFVLSMIFFLIVGTGGFALIDSSHINRKKGLKNNLNSMGRDEGLFVDKLDDGAKIESNLLSLIFKKSEKILDSGNEQYIKLAAKSNFINDYDYENDYTLNKEEYNILKRYKRKTSADNVEYAEIKEIEKDEFLNYGVQNLNSADTSFSMRNKTDNYDYLGVEDPSLTFKIQELSLKNSNKNNINNEENVEDRKTLKFMNFKINKEKYDYDSVANRIKQYDPVKHDEKYSNQKNSFNFFEINTMIEILLGGMKKQDARDFIKGLKKDFSQHQHKKIQNLFEFCFDLWNTKRKTIFNNPSLTLKVENCQKTIEFVRSLEDDNSTDEKSKKYIKFKFGEDFNKCECFFIGFDNSASKLGAKKNHDQKTASKKDMEIFKFKFGLK